LGNFSSVWQLFDAFCDFFKDKEAQTNGDILGYFLLEQIVYIFTQINNFKMWLMMVFKVSKVV
jgi:hypothetical protein